ncbi:putative sulfate exporter family transporter [Pseudodesulfovibrio sp. JC047]|uniref:YeiH family protein n=1 Tax=Pseudodesulfovibrio sp. JC047 TaxID=2683199 RepID=UPI0013D11A7E|nr:putative sulfate exporter family transporter [Pseudodesulfovibrio sp. JC047]NDV19963.1 putative sulfate exporter family transporter [Pseudodesulfovibrio sp. JC047]
MTGFSDVWKTEDYWAIWLGFFFLLVGLGLFVGLSRPVNLESRLTTINAKLDLAASEAPFKTIDYYTAVEEKAGIQARREPLGRKIASYVARPKRWDFNPLTAFVRSAQDMAADEDTRALYAEAMQQENGLFVLAQQAEADARASGFDNIILNEGAEAAIDAWHEAHGIAKGLKARVQATGYNIFPGLIVLTAVLAGVFAIGAYAMGKDVKGFVLAFPVLMLLAVFSYMMGEQETMKRLGFGYPAWAIVTGMIISNTVGTPKWMKPALETEYYIKTGLVLLGGELLFTKILAIGLPGLFVAWVVTPTVLILSYQFGQKILKIPSKTMNMVISADMSVCGTSAAIAAAAACKAKKEELTLSIGLSLLFTSVMMIVLPVIIKATGMPYILGGAWIGGTLDATGAVAAAGAFLSEEAMYVAATIKMIQNMLIGGIALGIAVYWATRVDVTDDDVKIGGGEIWNRFPKFILGFIFASVFFSLLYSSFGTDVGSALLENGVIRGMTAPLRAWLFCLAFASIGLATNFRELAPYFKGGKPVILYLCGQGFNLTLTLIMAYIMFYLVFPEITANI